MQSITVGVEQGTLHTKYWVWRYILLNNAIGYHPHHPTNLAAVARLNNLQCPEQPGLATLASCILHVNSYCKRLVGVTIGHHQQVASLRHMNSEHEGKTDCD
eukprot:5234898-Amphidinium_carterae.1